MRLQSKEAQDLKQVQIIVWDECSMIAAWQLEVVDHLMRRLKENDEPFGGFVCILAGDLRQLPPVVKNASRAELLEETVISSRLWSFFHPYSLTGNMRITPGEEDWGQYLLDVAEGRLNIPNTEEINIPNDMLLPSVNDLTSFVFRNFDSYDLHSSVVLAPTNEGVDEINNIALNYFRPDLPIQSFLSATSLIKDLSAQNDGCIYTRSRKAGSIPHHKIELKEGVPILLIRNLNLHQGLCNGTRMIVEKIFQNSILCKIVSGIHAGKKHFIPRITFCTREFHLPGTLRRIQLPIKVAFSITINRSQGHTYKGRVVIYLCRPPFSHEMCYVAISRGTRRNLIKIYVQDTSEQGRRNRGVGGSPSTREIIFTQNPIFFEILKHIPGFRH